MKQPRNHPCSCNSGLKFKKCCGSAAKFSEQYHEDKRQMLASIEKHSRQREEEAVKTERQISPTRNLIMAALLACATFPVSNSRK